MADDAQEQQQQLVMFDDKGTIHLYDPAKYEALVKTIELQRQYVGEMDDFRSVAAQTMTIVQRIGAAIEQAKLKAIGARNRVESEAEEQARMLQEAHVRLREKQMELDRYVEEYNALLTVEQEQQATFQLLSQAHE